MAKHPVRILTVGEDVTISHLVRLILTEEGYEAQTLHDAEQAQQSINETFPDLMIIDVQGRDSANQSALLDFVQQAQAEQDLPAILVVPDPQDLGERLGQLQRQGVGVLGKPFDVPELLRVVQEQLAQRREQPPS